MREMSLKSRRKLRNCLSDGRVHDKVYYMTNSRSIQFALWILATYAIGALLYDAASVFLWIGVSFFIFALLDRPAQKLKAKGYSTLITSLALVIAATAIVGGIVVLLAHFSSDMVIELEASKKIFIQYYNEIDRSLQNLSANLNHSVSGVNHAAPMPEDVQKVQVIPSSSFSGNVTTTLMHSVGSAVMVISFALLCPVLTFFLLAERDSLAKVFVRVFDDPMRAREMWLRIVSATRAFFLGNLVLGLVTYPIFVVIFLLFSVPSAFTLAALASVFNLVPFLGSILSGFLPALTLLGQGDHVVSSLMLYAVCILVHFSVANFVTPKILGAKVDINATTSTIALIAWGELWGGIGLILAIPLTAVIKIVFQYSGSEWLQWIAALMSENVDAVFDPAAKTEATDVKIEAAKVDAAKT
jgi:predicted PurR-regulated permease PerM